MEKGPPRRAALYARCSTLDKGQDPELQLSPLREYCHRREFKVSGEYIDNGISGSRTIGHNLTGSLRLQGKGRSTLWWSGSWIGLEEA